MDQEFVLEPAQPLVRDIEQFGASSLFLPFVEINVDRHLDGATIIGTTCKT